MRAPRLDLYRDADKQWRWRFASNGRILADSGQGYSRRIDALHGALLVLNTVDGRDVNWITPTYGQIPRNDGDVIEVRVFQ